MKIVRTILAGLLMTIAGAGVIVGPTAVLYLAGCGGIKGAKEAPNAYKYTDSTPKQEQTLTTQAAAASQASIDAGNAIKGNKTASDAIHDAQNKLAATMPDVPGAKGALNTADGALKDQVKLLNNLLNFANDTIATDNDVILNLSAQVDLNTQLQAEGKANGTTIATDAALITKYQAEDQDIFGKMRRAWETIKWVLLIGIPLIIVLGVLGVRYGADKIIAPINTGIGAVLGWAVAIGKFLGYYIGTFCLSLFPWVGHVFDETANDARVAIAKLEGKTTTTTPAPTSTPAVVPVTVAAGTPVVVAKA